MNTLDRGQIARRLDALADKAVPVSGALYAANWTRDRLTPPPDELIDVWIAVDDWVQAGSPAYGGFPGDKDDLYARLVAALTRFYSYVRGLV
jgi:hypothetical protein